MEVEGQSSIGQWANTLAADPQYVVTSKITDEHVARNAKGEKYVAVDHFESTNEEAGASRGWRERKALEPHITEQGAHREAYQIKVKGADQDFMATSRKLLDGMLTGQLPRAGERILEEHFSGLQGAHRDLRAMGYIHTQDNATPTIDAFRSMTRDQQLEVAATNTLVRSRDALEAMFAFYGIDVALPSYEDMLAHTNDNFRKIRALGIEHADAIAAREAPGLRLASGRKLTVLPSLTVTVEKSTQTTHHTASILGPDLAETYTTTYKLLLYFDNVDAATGGDARRCFTVPLLIAERSSRRDTHSLMHGTNECNVTTTYHHDDLANTFAQRGRQHFHERPDGTLQAIGRANTPPGDNVLGRIGRVLARPFNALRA